MDGLQHYGRDCARDISYFTHTRETYLEISSIGVRFVWEGQGFVCTAVRSRSARITR